MPAHDPQNGTLLGLLGISGSLVPGWPGGPGISGLPPPPPGLCCCCCWPPPDTLPSLLAGAPWGGWGISGRPLVLGGLSGSCCISGVLLLEGSGMGGPGVLLLPVGTLLLDGPSPGAGLSAAAAAPALVNPAWLCSWYRALRCSLRPDERTAACNIVAVRVVWPVVVFVQ